MANPGTGLATASRIVIMVVAALSSACSARRERSDEAPRPIPAEPTPLTFAGGAAPQRAGGGTYDGRATVLFDVFPGGQVVTKLYLSRHSAAEWSAPAPAIRGFDAWHAGGHVSVDGTRLYFESSRRDPAVTGREDTDLWVADRQGEAWGNARPLGPPFDTPHNEHNVTVSARETVCINSNRGGVTAGHDIMCAHRSGATWQEPYALDSAVNGPTADIAPFIDPEERFLVFASNRPGGAGAFDLYISVRRGGHWSPAIALGAGVNSAASESSPAVSPDGRRLLFSRTVAERVVLHEVRFDPRWIAVDR
jgi:hypothetical protein